MLYIIYIHIITYIHATTLPKELRLAGMGMKHLIVIILVLHQSSSLIPPHQKYPHIHPVFGPSLLRDKLNRYRLPVRPTSPFQRVTCISSTKGTRIQSCRTAEAQKGRTWVIGLSFHISRKFGSRRLHGRTPGPCYASSQP